MFLIRSIFIRSYFISFSFSAVITSSGSGTIPPRRPKCSTGTLHSTARRTSSTICPAFNSTVRIPFTCAARAAIAFNGNGHRVIGRSKPDFDAFFPSHFHCFLGNAGTRTESYDQNIRHLRSEVLRNVLRFLLFLHNFF